ncbi:phage major capsid protein, P2 family [Desulfovibrio sp. X2]|uniref:phage major capsid protein, P2 family n=1 Tax=Desulfovibrio sp. X2 TaxID=941449 RepID=UPI000358B020|nr:phage major capsid protein, P2 family [Desulfovibrio sp. X2]EPR43129.1 phage major capsid protein, P2 family [Desulfovibrio sp. X2]
MRLDTRKLFAALLGRLASTYGVASVEQQFSIDPTVAQRLTDKIVEQATFLPKINVIQVDELKGQNILGYANAPVTGRTDTTQAGKERTPRNVVGLGSYGYELLQTNADVAMPYRLMDAWAKFADFMERYARYVQQRMGSDMELIGWYGTSASADTDPATYPLLQDVNKGWLQYLRDNLSGNVLSEGATPGEIRIGATGDWANLDVAVLDLQQGIPQYMRQGLVALIGSDLIAKEKSALYAAIGDKPTEKALVAAGMTTFGGLPWETPSNFPARGIVVTSYDNLSIYQQSGSWRRQVVDNPKKDQVEDYNCRNEGYVVETPEKMVALEFANVRLPDGAGGWE